MLQKNILGFLSTIELELKDTVLEEVTFNTLQNMLQCACRNDYVYSEDKVLEQFNLDKLSGRFSRNVEYGENLIDYANKKTVYEEAERYLARDLQKAQKQNRQILIGTEVSNPELSFSWQKRGLYSIVKEQWSGFPVARFLTTSLATPFWGRFFTPPFFEKNLKNKKVDSEVIPESAFGLFIY